jgi:hypothetical protein
MIVHLIEARRNEISIATASVRSQIVGSPASQRWNSLLSLHQGAPLPLPSAASAHSRPGVGCLDTPPVFHRFARRIEPAPETGSERTPAVPIRRSVHRDYLVCLDCGWRGQMLKRHIASQGLSVEQYRARWNLPL